MCVDHCSTPAKLKAFTVPPTFVNTTRSSSATGDAAVLSLKRLDKSVVRVPGISRRHSSFPVVASKHKPSINEPVSVSLFMTS